MKKLFLIVTLAIQILMVRNLNAQIDLQMIIRNPPPSEIYQWQQDPTIIQLIATNQTTTEYQNVTFGFRISNEDGVVLVECKYNDPSTPRFIISSFPQPTILNGSQIVNVNAIEYNRAIYSTSQSSNILTNALIPNTIPEGYYEICISAYDQNGKNITNGQEYCTSFTIMIPEPPIILSPMDDEIVNIPFPNFIWSPVTGFLAGGTQIKYKLKICPVFRGQTPRMAIDNNPVLIEKNDILTTSYMYMPSDLPFDYYRNVERFVWMVQAFDQNDNPASKNQGKSELATFKFEKQRIPDIALDNIYPSNLDTIPWKIPHLVTQFTPYSDEIHSIEFTLHCKKDGENKEYTNSRIITFNGGPQAGQQLNSSNQASLLVASVGTNKVTPEWMKQLEYGVKYNWFVEATFTFENGLTQQVTSQETSFIIGFKQAKLSKPVKDTSIKVNTKINCIFSIPSPENLNFANVDVLNMHAFHASNIKSQALNKFSIEVSKKSSFDSIAQVQLKTIPENQIYQTGSTCDELYNNITVELNGIKDTSKYYYRINYLDDSDNKYYTSPVSSFKIIPDSLKTCFEMKVEDPPNNGVWKKSKKPDFSVSVKPEINKSAITGGRIRVWKKTSSTQSNSEAKSKKAVLDTTFKGNSDNKIFAFSTDMSGYTRYNLTFINGDSTSKSFTADTATTYLWNFQLDFKKDSIRDDKLLCDADSVISDDGIFTVKPTSELADSGYCPGECYADEPTNTSPGTQSLKKDSTITIGKFKLKLGNVTGTASNLIGEGSIDVPYLRGNISVEFEGLKVNSDNVVYEGEAYGKIDQAAPYTKSDANDFEGKALNYAQDKAKFKEIHEYSSSSGKLVSALVGTTPVTLPLGFDRDYDGYKVVIGIVAMKFTPVRASLNTAMYVELPSLGPDVGLGLGAKDICFHNDGLAGNGKKTIYLAQDFGYNNEDSWSFLFKAPTPTDSGTYAIWGCEGFNELVIAADVAFPRSWFKPAPDPDPTKLVKAHFKARADKFGNGWEWMGIASLDECELSGAEGYKMKVQEMVFDYSKARNPGGIVFPENYTGDKDLHWQGFYIKTASIEFPEKLKTFENEHPTISVNNLLIDKTGLTAIIQGANIIQYPKGNFGGWGASIDTLKIGLISSSLQTGKINGRVRASTFDTSLVYNGIISNITGDKKLKYLFSIHPRDSVDISCLKAKLDLYPTTKIELRDTAGKFEAVLDLTGKLNLENTIGGLKKINFKGISFQNLKFFSYSPYFEEGNIGLASPQHGMSGFPVNIDNIDIVTGTRSGAFGAGLQFDLMVSLQSGSNAISGTTKLSIWTKLNTGENGQRFSFDGVDLDSLGVNADMGAVRIAGGLELYDSHSTFGDGFRGVVDATFVDKVSVAATAQFGSVNDYKYWYVDAKAIFPTAVPIVSGIGLYGFGGGAWYHMQKSDTTDLSSSAISPDASGNAGTTNSGYKYTPNKNVNLGLKATMVIGTHPSADAFNGDVGLEAQFISGGGLGTVSLVGKGYMMCGITKRNKAKVLADLDLEYNVPTETFHGIFDVNIDTYPLIGSGQMVMHVDPGLWYMKIGEPANPIHLSLADWLEAQSYLMIGQGLPTPQVPIEIQELFSGQIMDRKPSIATGDGFVFGANTGFDTGRKTYMGFYGDFSALAGFDMSLLDYSDGARCEGMDDPMGINGWYAYGQIYSYLSASIGLHVDLWFTEGNYEILNMQAGTILQGAGPNPTWLQGTVEGNYRILGGRVKGHCNFDFSMGDQCEMIQENPLSRIDLITDINPVSGTEKVDVMIEPQVATNFQLNESFDLQEMSEGDAAPRVRTFKVKLKDFNLRKSSNNDSIAGKVNIAPDKFSAYYSSHDILPGYSNFDLDVSAYGEELIDNVWQPAVKTDGSLIVQTESTSFKTGPEPDKIEEQFVAYTYPVRNQNYFLQDECNKGIIQLKTGLPNLFAVSPMYQTEYLARFVPTAEDAPILEVPFTYVFASKSLNFPIPDLRNSTEYYIQFVKKSTPKQTDENKRMDNDPGDETQNAENTRAQQQKVIESVAGEMIITDTKIKSIRIRETEKILYAMKFTTSKYNTLQAKLNAYNFITVNSDFYADNQEVHKIVYEGDESFGYHDLQPTQWNKSGTTYSMGPLIKVNGNERSASWHTSFVNPKVYDNIQWMISKNWWNTSYMTEFNHYIYSDNLDLVEIKANGYYQPPATGYAQMVSQTSTPIYSSSSTGISAGSAASGMNYTFGTSTIAGTSSGFVSTGSAATGASTLTGSSSGAYSGSSFSPGNASGMSLSDFQALADFTPNLILTYNHGKVVPVDFNRLRNKAVNVLSSWYLYPSNSDKSKLNSILNTEYQPMFNGSYPLKFYYNYRGCLGVDENSPTINKPFTY